MIEPLTSEDRRLLLDLARQALEAAVAGCPAPTPLLSELSPRLQAPGASFVTLTRRGELRGCIGALEARRPLALDVCDHAAAAAQQDFRFPPVTVDELPEIEIEISALTVPQRVDYHHPQELINCLRVGIDGVTLTDGRRRATFLPQVWHKLPSPEQFLSHLCLKMGVPPDLWRTGRLGVQTYQVEEFHEARNDPQPGVRDSAGCSDL